MIVIEGENFKMVQTSGPFFDLTVPVKVNAGKDNEREDMKLIAHSLTFNECVNQVISSYQHRQEVYTPAEYVQSYIDAVHKLVDQFRLEDKPKRIKKEKENVEE